MDKWKCECGNVFTSNDYIPFERLPSCPKCGQKTCISIPKCSECETDALSRSHWVYDKKGEPLMKFFGITLCDRHWKEFLKTEKELRASS